MSRSVTIEAVVLKRVNTGESDRVVTLLTPDQGKLTCVAKGVRKLISSRGAALEPGNYVTVLLVPTKSLAILTQAKLIQDFAHLKKDLKGLKRLTEVLEIIDQLFPEGVEEPVLFRQVVHILELLNSEKIAFTEVQDQLKSMLVSLGYQDLEETPYNSILEYVSVVAEKPLRSYDYLTVKST